MREMHAFVLYLDHVDKDNDIQTKRARLSRCTKNTQKETQSKDTLETSKSTLVSLNF